MTSIDRDVRVRAAIEERFSLILIGLLILALVAGWWAYQVHMVPEFEQEERVVEQWSEGTDFDHRATIVNDSLVWDPGDVVENRPIYYTNLSDTLDGTYSYSYSAETGNIRATTDIMLVIQAIDSLDQIDDPFWRYAVPIAEGTEQNLQPDEAHTVEFSVDIVTVLDIIETIERQLDAREGLVDVRVEVVSDIEGEVESQDHAETFESDMPMVVNPQTYRVLDQETVAEEHSESVFIEVTVQPSPIEELGSIGLFILLIMATLGLVLGRATGQFDITEKERELLQLETEREEFDDWITVGKFPAERDYESTILVDNLVGLVDVAIDTNNRVIEDPELGVSAVLADNYVYIYVHPDSPARDWLVNYADVTMEEFEGDVRG